MTTTDSFTTPAEAERVARVKQAHDFFALAMTPTNLVTPDWEHRDYQLDYENGVQAVRDALVGQGHAMLAVRDELADIAASLRTLAAAPTAVANVALAVTAVQETLQELGNDVCDVHTAIEESGAATVNAIQEHSEALDTSLFDIAYPVRGRRWWQFWRRPTVVRAEPVIDDNVPFRIDVRDTTRPEGPLAVDYFRADFANAVAVAEVKLPELCQQAGIDADPDRLCGQVFIGGRVGESAYYLDTVFLPGATVITAPPEGF